MKNLIKPILAALFTVTCLLISSVSDAALPKIIRFATEATYPPFEYMDASGEIKGFDIDIAKEICAEIKAQCTFTNQPWDSLIPSLKLGKFDALISAMNITDARKQQVDFTIPYFVSTGSFVAPSKQTIGLTPENLKGKIIGVQTATTFETYLKNHYQSTIKIKTYANIQSAFLDLNAGRIDVLFGDTPTINDWLKANHHNNQYTVVGKPINDPLFGAGYGIAIQKGNTELLDAFNKAITKIKHEPAYQKNISNL